MKKLLSIICLFIALIGFQVTAQGELAQTPDQPIETLQFPFNGQWMPSADPLQVGPENYRVLTNLRYTASGSLESVGGYSKINTTVLSGTPELDAGFHFKKDNPTETHVLVNADGTVYQNTTAIPNQGDFAATALHTDAAGAGDPRFSQAPYGHVAYTNGVETMIWAGNEMPVAAFITSTATVAQNPTNPKDYTQAVNNDITTGQNVAIIGGGIDSYAKLLMHIDEADAGTAFDDAIGTHNPANNGNAQADTSQAKFGMSSGLFDGTGDFVSIADHADFDLSTGTSTIDFWVRFNALPSANNAMVFYSQRADASNMAVFFLKNYGGNYYFTLLLKTSGANAYPINNVQWSTPVINTWYHIALIRGWGGNANDWTVAVNGTSMGTVTLSTAYPNIAASYQIASGTTEVVAEYPTDHSDTYVKATTKYSTSYWPYFATNPALSVTGGRTSLEWLAANGTVTNQRFHIDIGTASVLTRFSYENSHTSGSDTVAGVNNFTLWGSNEASAFADLTYGTDTNWTQLTTSQSTFDEHAAADTADTKYITVTNSTAYRYYAFKFADNHGSATIMGVRNISLNPVTLIAFNGWLDEYRLSKGVARWSSGFAVPVRAYSPTAITWLVGSPRPLQGVKYYLGNANTIVSNISVSEWQGYSWTALSVTNNTDNGGVALGQNGTVTWTATGEAKPKFIENRLMYWYQFAIDAGEAEIYRVTLDAPWQNLVDIWDGVYRQPIQFQAYKSAKYQDYTYDVNDENADTYYADLGALTNAEHVILMFDDRATALNFTMVAGKENVTAATVTIYYWDGSNWATVGPVTDTTLDSATSTKSLGQSGHMSWNPPDEEVEFYKTSFGTTGYAYKLVWSGTLTASNAQVNTLYGVPAQKTIHPFKFPAMYKDRLFLCGYTEGGEGNRCDYSMAYTAQVFNGAESSDGGVQSLYFGGSSDLTAATQLYNRMGSNIFIFFLALKEGETYVLTGDGPETYQIYPVSMNIGCPAPKSLVVAEVGFDIANDVQRHVALWVSYAGPVIFDGAVIYQVPGLENYFDPNHPDYLGQTAIRDSFAWFDQTYREYNIVTGSFWVTYNLKLKRWFKKETGSAEYPISAWPVRDTYGNEYVYAGLDNGFMNRLEYGTSWDGVGITQRVQTGDFWPTKNIWDLSRIRRIKLIAKRIPDANGVSVVHYADGDESAVSNWNWEDTTGLVWDDSAGWIWDTGNSVMLLDISGGSTGNRGRIIRSTQPVNLLGWIHGLRFEMTSTDTEKGFQPIMWGVEYLRERRDQ